MCDALTDRRRSARLRQLLAELRELAVDLVELRLLLVGAHRLVALELDLRLEQLELADGHELQIRRFLEADPLLDTEQGLALLLRLRAARAVREEKRLEALLGLRIDVLAPHDRVGCDQRRF